MEKDEAKDKVKGTLPALADQLREWFPEFNGRCLAVAEMNMSKDVKPSLPIILVSLIKEPSKHSVKTRKVLISQEILVEFWVASQMYPSANGAQSPFWGYYDFETIRDRVLEGILNWVTPRGTKLEYDGLIVDANEYATQICIRFKHTYDYCEAPRMSGPLRFTFEAKPFQDSSCTDNPCNEANTAAECGSCK